MKSSELTIGQKYQFSNGVAPVVFIGECDISDQYHFGAEEDPCVIQVTLEESDLKQLTPL